MDTGCQGNASSLSTADQFKLMPNAIEVADLAHASSTQTSPSDVEDRTIMHWYCIIIVDGERRDASPTDFVVALRRAWQEGGQPARAAAFVNRGSASRFTFVVSPEVAAIANDLLERYGATCCTREPKLTRYDSLCLRT